MKKISILSLHLGHGGIEKAVTDLANNLCDKYEVKIVSVYKTFETLPFQVDSRVKIQYLIYHIIAGNFYYFAYNFFFFSFFLDFLL